jgi:hypothetical protein
MAELRFSELSAPRQALIRRCQRIGFGKILGLAVHQCEPEFGPGTEVLLDIKLGSSGTRRPEQNLLDFSLCAEVVEFLENLDAIGNGSVEHLEIRAGIPVRMLLKASVQDQCTSQTEFTGTHYPDPT